MLVGPPAVHLILETVGQQKHSKPDINPLALSHLATYDLRIDA